LNFALILFLLSVFTGIFWCAEVFYFKKRREAKFVDAVKALDARLANQNIANQAEVREREVDLLTQKVRMAPVWLEFPASFFPVIAIVFTLRSFVVEPFKIPTGSMIPTLEVGDFILVNKFSYGLRLPVIHTKILDVGKPERGDVMVFRYPPDPSMDYIKRVIGLPGDKIVVSNKRVSVNGVDLPLKKLPDYLHGQKADFSSQFSTELGRHKFRYLTDDYRPVTIDPMLKFPHFENCLYNSTGVTCTVPPGHFFMMGDNRDNSLDSRFWGFVPEENIVGRAFGIWMNWSGGLNFNLSRIGGFE
jgi:signal peptidase I